MASEEMRGIKDGKIELRVQLTKTEKNGKMENFFKLDNGFNLGYTKISPEIYWCIYVL